MRLSLLEWVSNPQPFDSAFNKTIKFDGQDFYLQLVDTAGQDEYSIFSRSHTVDVHGYVLVYSVTSMKSFEVIKAIRSKLLDMVGKIHRPSSPHYAPPLEPPCFCQMCRIPTVLVANKRDLSKQRVVQTEEGKKLADSWGAAFLESSAKQNDTTVEIFKMMIQEIEKADGYTQDRKCDMM
ncbi:GTP-binding protein Rheb-like isoform X2 [Heterodontus francisci]|uniref:GTP-binding protein Rheb-like isoform X2 n=1 Tax=Heterodontus francisci TaxID=7792 RepID=UPI00355C7BD8